MIDALAPLYRSLPHPARSLAASARGLYLRRWRYGRETDALVEEALERDTWSPERWKAWQEESLARLLWRAASKVPFYRSDWERRRQAGDTRSPERLENWPILRKEALRENPLAFVAEDRDPARMFRNRTGGTTGTPLSIYATRRTLVRHYALFEARVRRWHGVSRRDRWAILGGQLVVSPSRTVPPFWVRNAASNQLYLSTYHLSPAAAPAYARELRRYAPTHLLTYPSSGAVLAGLCLDAGIELPKLPAVFSNAEMFLDSQRDLLSRAFGCAARDTYGLVEMAAAASECREGSLHLWPEEGFVEVLEDGSGAPATGGEAGRLVATGLVNEDMPLVRYESGDRGAVAPSACGCGRSLPLLERVEGRCQDLIVTRSGRRIWYWNPVFYGLPVAQGQIVQERLDAIRVRVVAAGAFGEREERELAARVGLRLGGDASVAVEVVAELPRTARGKVRPVISLLGRGGDAGMEAARDA